MEPTKTAELIEQMREMYTGKGNEAATAIVAAFDSATSLVKMIPARTCHLDITCPGGAPVSLGDLNPALALQMLQSLVGDPDVTHICLMIEPK